LKFSSSQNRLERGKGIGQETSVAENKKKRQKNIGTTAQRYRPNQIESKTPKKRRSSNKGTEVEQSFKKGHVGGG